MHVVEAGRRADPDADVILFVHGFPENWYMWNQVLKNEKLSSKYHLVAINLRGYGGSSKPLGKLNYTVTKITNDMRAVVEAVTAKKTKKSTIVVSHDWGGAASWAFSQRFPELVSRLVVINCPPASLLGRNMTWRQLSKSWYIVVFQVPGMGAALMTSNKARGLAAMFPRQDVADVHRYNALQPGAMTCMVDYYRANINEPEIKGKVRCPALVIWGLNDIALDPTTCLADLDKYIMEDPGKMEMRILEDTGHFVVDERPELVVDLIEEWLGSKDK